MKIKEENGLVFEVCDLDRDNEIEFIIEKGYDVHTYAWLGISETIELIKFLQEQVDNFNNKMI